MGFGFAPMESFSSIAVGVFSLASAGLILDVVIAHLYRIIAAAWER